MAIGVFAVLVGGFLNVIVQAGHPIFSMAVLAWSLLAVIPALILGKAAAISRVGLQASAFLLGVLAGNLLVEDLGRWTIGSILVIAIGFTLAVGRFGSEPFRFAAIIFAVIGALSPAFQRPFLIEEERKVANTDLMPLLHIILDEQEAGTLAGFSVWPNALTRHSATTASLPFILDGHAEHLREAGYAVRTIQSSYLSICDAECATYDFSYLGHLDGLPITARMELLINAWLQQFDMFYVKTLSPAPLNSRFILENIEKPKPGEALIVHVILPHAPYYYAEDCTLRPDPSSKGSKDDRTKYDAQSACAKALVPRFDDVFTIVHGDHGARLFPLEGTRNLYGAMFARRVPGEAARIYHEERYVSDLLYEARQDLISKR